MPTEILTSGNNAAVAQEKWNDECFREYLDLLKLNLLMGDNENNPIFVKEDLKKGEGDAFTITYASSQDGGIIRGSETGEGNEGKMNFYAQRFTVGLVRSLHRIKNVLMANQRVSFSVMNEMKHALTRKHAETLEKDIIDMLCDTGAGRVRGRYLYGALDSNWNDTHETALANIDNVNDKLSWDIIVKAKNKATQKGIGVSQVMTPIGIKDGGLKYEDYWIMLVHTYAARDLMIDEKFRQNWLFVPPSKGNEKNIYFTGNHFKGNVDGVLVYEYSRIPTVVNSNGVQCAHNILLGQKAGVLCWAQRSKYTDKYFDYGHEYGAELADIRSERITGASNNLKCVYKDGTNAHDYGVVNVFTAAVADA